MPLISKMIDLEDSTISDSLLDGSLIDSISINTINKNSKNSNISVNQSGGTIIGININYLVSQFTHIFNHINANYIVNLIIINIDKIIYDTFMTNILPLYKHIPTIRIITNNNISLEMRDYINNNEFIYINIESFSVLTNVNQIISSIYNPVISYKIVKYEYEHFMYETKSDFRSNTKNILNKINVPQLILLELDYTL